MLQLWSLALDSNSNFTRGSCTGTGTSAWDSPRRTWPPAAPRCRSDTEEGLGSDKNIWRASKNKC